jgi:hypothetical protein
VTAYDDLASPEQMRADAVKVGPKMPLVAPSIRFEDYPREVRKRDITISEAARRLADALELHLD